MQANFSCIEESDALPPLMPPFPEALRPRKRASGPIRPNLLFGGPEKTDGILEDHIEIPRAP